ncbi:MAG TPA: DUF4149 domain-containing protein [Verrucomicrobiae bacterium]|jgi:hypothetical protein|nr:DUF4149 domain-containing protein [Verrucomicrobiae bacterium]
MNAAVWLGTVIFFTFGAEPACFSADMHAALGATGDSYFPGAIAGVVMSRYYHVTLACGVVALLHLLAEWGYMGRPTRKFSFALVAGLFLLTLIGSNAIQPSLTRLNRKHYTATQPADRESAAKSFHLLHATSRVFALLIIGGLIIYVWRVGSPSDTLRFVRPVQFRG